MKVLSLFDGISCARVALERAGIEVESYFASEVDKYAIQISKKNYPGITHLGDIKMMSGFFKKEIDLLIGGSPCQDLSISTSKKRKGLNGSKSSLFFEYIKILKEANPKWFILENVASMSKESKDIISREMGVQPIEINSNHFSAQNRARLFWTNIPVAIPSQSSRLTLKDIIENEVDEKFFYKGFPVEIKDLDKNVIGTIGVAGHDILKRIYNLNKKSPTVTTCGGGNTQIKIMIGDRVRKLTPIEYERLQGLPDNYTYGISNSQRYKCLGNGFNVDVIAYIISHIK